MSSFWWFDPGWKKTTCARCGKNIWDSGGDPDWGLCYDCFCDSIREERKIAESVPLCDICGKYPAVTDVNGYGVCSLECDYAARDLPKKERQVDGPEWATKPAASSPLCDICGKNPAVTAVNGYGVCSIECDHAAKGLQKKGT